MRSHYVVVLGLAISGSALAVDWFEGENLLLEPPDKEKYEAYVKEEPGWRSTMWVDRETEGTDTVTVNVLSGHRPRLSKFRSSQDEPGKKSCDRFESRSIDDVDRNRYRSSLWATECASEGTTISTIQLAIQGRDSFYHIRKLWKRKVTESEYAAWQQRLSDAALCDTRAEKHPCPDGLEKVGESPDGA